MPSKQAKQRKLDRKTANKTLKVGKTDKQRKQRLANKAKRDEILAIMPDAKIVIINGVPYIDDVRVKVINGTVCAHDDASNAAADYGDKDDVCVHGNALSSNCSDCFHEQFKEAESYKDDIAEDAHSGAEELARYTTGETVAVKPEPASMWDKLKNKWEKV